MDCINRQIMKLNIIKLGITLLLINGGLLFGQSKCKVLMKQISGDYVGKCKRGLANGYGVATGIDRYEGKFRKGYPNGEGTYTWSTGETYTGDWSFGDRDGIGVYKFEYFGKDSIQEGVWKKDKYMGPVPPPPKVIIARNLEKYNFIKQSEGNTLSIFIYQNGTVNSTIENLSIFSSNGSYQNLGNKLQFSEIVFPCTFKITYKTWNKLHTAQLDAAFEFEISEPGNWILRITN